MKDRPKLEVRSVCMSSNKSSVQPMQPLCPIELSHIFILCTSQERLTQVTKAQQQAVYVTKRRKVKSLFETWDNNSSGFLDLEELQDLICKWRAFSDEKGREQGRAVNYHCSEI